MRWCNSYLHAVFPMQIRRGLERSTNKYEMAESQKEFECVKKFQHF
jgi:hypothetical protein